MTLSYETGARKLEQNEIDLINYADVHPHDPKKVIALSGAARTAAPHPSMRSRHRRSVQKAAMQRKLLVVYPRYLSLALLGLFVYLRLATFSEVPVAGMNGLWISAYALAAISVVFSRLYAPARKQASGEKD